MKKILLKYKIIGYDLNPRQTEIEDYTKLRPDKIFVIDVFLGGKSGFCFLDSIKEKFPAAHEDSIIITGSASDDVVNMCISSNINHLLEKPIRPYALQLAVRAIVTKYLPFVRRLLRDPAFAANVSRF